MSHALLERAERFGLSDADIATRTGKRRSSTSDDDDRNGETPAVDPSTVNRVVRGVTENPKVATAHAIAGGMSITDADHHVLMRRLLDELSVVLRPSALAFVTFEEAARYAKDALNSGKIKDAAEGVRAMVDLAASANDRADAYCQAAGVLKAIGDYEAAKANYEAADRLLPEDCVAQKVKLLVNLASLHVRMGQLFMGVMLAEGIIRHPHATESNKGWACLTMGDAAVAKGDHQAALGCYRDAYSAFERGAEVEGASKTQGNLLWTEVQINHAEALCGDKKAVAKLREMEDHWQTDDPEVAETAAAYRARCVNDHKALQRIRRRAQKKGLGEVVMMVDKFLAKMGATVMALLLVASVALSGGVSTPAPFPAEQVGSTGSAVIARVETEPVPTHVRVALAGDQRQTERHET